MRQRLILAGLLLGVAGCTSISSTLLNRTDNDLYVGNSNGDVEPDGETRPFKGVPITVRVPTHLDVAIKESIMLARDTDGQLYQLTGARRQLFVEAALVDSDKVFTVDPRRPAAGTSDFTLTFGDASKDGKGADNSQYFRSIAYQIQDDTIKEVNNSLKTLLPLIGKATAAGAGGGAESLTGVTEEPVGVIAWKRFDLDAPDFEFQVECFVNQHLNQFDTCGPPNSGW